MVGSVIMIKLLIKLLKLQGSPVNVTWA